MEKLVVVSLQKLDELISSRFELLRNSQKRNYKEYNKDLDITAHDKVITKIVFSIEFDEKHNLIQNKIDSKAIGLIKRISLIGKAVGVFVKVNGKYGINNYCKHCGLQTDKILFGLCPKHPNGSMKGNHASTI